MAFAIDPNMKKNISEQPCAEGEVPQARVNRAPQLISTMNQALAEHIRQHLKVCDDKTQHSVTDKSPKEYFKKTQFWDYSEENAMENWDYCFSRLRTKEKIIDDVYIGTRDYALVKELGQGDYSVQSETYFAQYDPPFHLVCKDEEAAASWLNIKNEIQGTEHRKVAFTRVISVVKHDSELAELKGKLGKIENRGSYSSAITEHRYVSLRDLPKDGEEKEDQWRQWQLLEAHFPGLFKMIDQAREERQPILIHCTQGRHRSAAILTAYLVSRLNLTVNEAMTFIRSKRNCAIPYTRSEFSPWLTQWSEKS